MITFPPEFVVTRYSGYFWNTQTQRLFSIKVTGELRELYSPAPNKWNNWQWAYKVSHQGKKKLLTIAYLKTLNPQTIPVVYK